MDVSTKRTATEKRIARRYTLQYLLAMALVAASILLGAAHIWHVLDLSRLQAQVIETASEQRTLAQQLVLLPDRYATENNIYKRGRVLVTMAETVATMRDGHEFLMSGTPNRQPPAKYNEALRRLYGSTSGGLDRSISRFLAFYENYAANPDVPVHVVDLQRVNAENFLFFALDNAVALHTDAAEQKMSDAIDIHKRWVVVSMVLIALVILCIFRPLTRNAAATVWSISAERDDRAKLLSHSLRIAKLGYWRAFDRADDSFWLSKELVDLLGLDLEEGFHQSSLIWSNEVPCQNARVDDLDQATALSHAWQTAAPNTARTRYRKPNGDVLDLLVRVQPEFDETGEITSVVGVVKDDTVEAEAKRGIEESLEIIERKSADLIEAQRLGRLATWRWRVDSPVVEWDEGAFRLLRVDPETFVATVENIRGIILDDGVERTKAMNEKVIRNGEEHAETVRARRGDGSIIDLHIRTKLELDHDGNPFAFFGTYQDVTNERKAARELEQLAFYDALTGLANRALFSRELKRICEVSAERNQLAALMLIDLDHFKQVNDTLGHQAGDELLGIIGDRLREAVPASYFVARLGGDEFAILCENVASRSILDWVANDVIESISRPAPLSLGVVQTNASLGISLTPAHSSNPDELLRFADLALYDSKENGRARSSYYVPALSDALGVRMSLETEIRSALDEKRFEAHFQPIVSAQTTKVTGFEALLRLPTREGGFIPPSEFIPVAEKSRLIADLGAFVLHKACREAQSWIEDGHPERVISVNVSAAQVWHGDLEEVVDNALQSSGLDPRLLCLELTETVFVADSIDRLGRILERLKKRGIQLALDDFGTGYSSLGYLNRLPFDKLKIDRTFVSNAPNNSEKHKMLVGVVSLAKGLNLRVTAEGVETEDELKLVRQIGCDDVQGWFFGIARPGQDALRDAKAIEASAAPAAEKPQQARA